MYIDQEDEFRAEITALCKRYDIEAFAGFCVSGAGGSNFSFLAAPWAKPAASSAATRNYSKVVCDSLDLLFRRFTPLPPSLTYYK